MATKKKSNNAKAWEIGGAVTAAALAAAAGAYLLSDKKTKAKAKAWVSKAKAEVAKHAKAAKQLSKAEYGRLVEKAVKQYGSMEKMTAGDVMMAAKELKAEWDHIQAHAKKVAKAVKKPVAKKKATTKKKARA
jgi:hypothetical protein